MSNKDTALEVPEAGKERPTYTFEAKPYPCSSMSRTEDANHWLTRTSMEKPPPTSEVQAEASCIQVSNKSLLCSVQSYLSNPCLSYTIV